MMKAIQILKRFLGARSATDRAMQACLQAWRRDPLSHPQLQTMSQQALADLQFDPKAVKPE